LSKPEVAPYFCDRMWSVALAFLLGLMALFHALTRAGPLEARATLALGFLLLAAHMGGEFARRVRLPRLTGFLMTGLVVGPAWLGLVRSDEVQALGFIADGAVALVAFAAGSELTLERLRRDRVALARLAVGTIVFPFAIVAAVVYSVHAWFPLTVHQPAGDALAVALVLGTLAAASSPAVTMALIDELDARGPFARSVLGVTVAKDVAVLVLFALVLANSRALASAGSLDATVAWTTFVRVPGSLAAGGALGYAVAQYLKMLRRDTPLFLVALAFFAAQVARLLGLETILVALAAGFVIENYFPIEGQRLRGEMNRGALPVYVVFFALAGAALRVDVLAALWPWLALLVGLRAVALRVGTTWAGRSPAVMPALARHGWLGFISQAGVALGLAAVARRAFPEWGVSLEAIVVAMVGVHEIVGPICFRRGLRLASELSEGEHVTEPVAAPDPALAPGSGGV
jgi:Kef-type K+ transport system membrane component KefB